MRINVAYAVPAASKKASSWHDGFTAAIGCLAQCHEIEWLNLHPTAVDRSRDLRRLGAADFLIVKSNWGWIVDEAVRSHCRSSSIPKGLMISGTARPPDARQMQFYEVLYYETQWYETQLQDHPHRVHAFGIDTSVMRPQADTVRDIDWLSVGQVVGYKRHERLLDRSGVRIVVGDLLKADPKLLTALRQGGVQVIDFVDYTTLAEYYRRARNVLVACTLQGGGERAVLEARACGATVHVADDNPKLQQLLHQSSTWDHRYYAAQLLAGYELARHSPRPPGAARGFTRRLRSLFGYDKRSAKRSAVSFSLGLCAALLLSSALAQADRDEPEQIYVADQLSYEDNLLRLPSAVLAVNVPPPGARSIEDYVNRITAGINEQLPFGRQVLDLKLRADDVRYERNDQLDHVAGNGRIGWDWLLFGPWSGTVAAEYTRGLADFSNTQLVSRDLLETLAYAGELRFQLGPRWSALTGARHARTEHSAQARQADDFLVDSARFGIEYATPVGHSVVLEYRYSNVEFPNLTELTSSRRSREYDESMAQIRATYVATVRTRLQASFGYVRRQYPDGGAGEFSGAVWRAAIAWQPRVRFQLDLAGWRELRAYTDAESDYFVSQGASLGPSWRPIRPLTLSLAWTWQEQQYIGSNPLLIESSSRADEVSFAQARLVYTPIESLRLELSYRADRRDSNRDRFEYEAQVAAAAVRWTF